MGRKGKYICPICGAPTAKKNICFSEESYQDICNKCYEPEFIRKMSNFETYFSYRFGCKSYEEDKLLKHSYFKEEIRDRLPEFEYELKTLKSPVREVKLSIINSMIDNIMGEHYDFCIEHNIKHPYKVN